MRSINPDPTSIAPHSWDCLPWGRQQRSILEKQLAPWWEKWFGWYLLKVGPLSGELDSSACRIGYQITTAPRADALAQVCCAAEHLPFAPGSIDVCLLAHTLAYSAHPHQVLREVDRVLMDDGWLILTGFNPYSIAGALTRCRTPRGTVRMYSVHRQLDWLSVLNYEVVSHVTLQLLPWHTHLLVNRLPAFGGLTLIVARKRTLPLSWVGRVAGPARFPLKNALGVTCRNP